MSQSPENSIDAELDLVFERIVDVPPEQVYAAWTQPELIVKWFTPAPWQTSSCEVDLRPGGLFRTVMRSPEGQDFPNEGCWLEIVPNRKIVWTCALRPGYRPRLAREHPFLFTAIITMEPNGTGTRYRAHLMHMDAEGKKKHEEMGFHAGWGKALDQLVAMVKS